MPNDSLKGIIAELQALRIDDDDTCCNSVIDDAIAIFRQHQAAPPWDVVERVAIALCLYVDGRRRNGPSEEIWLGLSEALKDAYRDQAKAAIAAMGGHGDGGRADVGSNPAPSPKHPSGYPDAPIPCLSIIQAMSKEIQEAWGKYRDFINKTPEVQSLLYDLDLMPEQICQERNFVRMLQIAEYMKDNLQRREIPVVDQRGLEEAILTLRPRVWMDYQDQAMIGQIPMAQIPILTEMWSVNFRPYLEKAIGAYLSTREPVMSIHDILNKVILSGLYHNELFDDAEGYYKKVIQTILDAAGVKYVD